MSNLIPILPLSGGLSPKETLSGGLSRDITRKSYNDLLDKPQINTVELVGNKTFEDLGLSAITPQEIDNIIFGGDD